jgi:hypothetical protein
MDYDLPAIANTFIWPLVVLIVAVVFFIIFKDRLTELEFDPTKRKMRFKFGERLNKARRQAIKIEKTVADSGAQSTSERMAVIGNQRSREVVIEAWGTLKQTVFDAAAAYNIPLTPSTSIQTVLSQLAAHGTLDHDATGLILLLDELGQELMAESGLKPHIDDARAFKALADVIVDWMMLEHISNRNKTKSPELLPETPPHHCATVVGGYFQPPAAGQPAANLIGIGGVVNGWSVPIETVEFKIGKGRDNDLRIKGDDYVSGHHALIRFDNGSLFIYDLDSYNGTFLNEKQVTGAVAVLQPGDHIRLGQAVFQLYQPTSRDATLPPRSKTTIIR